MGRNHDGRLGWERCGGGGWIAAVALLACAAGPGRAPAQEQAPASETAAPAGLQEVVVTATRREENLSRVPISVTALTQEALDARGIKDFSEVARFTPGVNFDNSGTNNISIRGISGTGGAGTTGIYIDDTPIQMRALAFNPDEALPKSFDLDRIEVLRGPQGTLFGSGSEGGTVRYITTQPSVTHTSMYARAELATTQGGDPSYEAGVAVGGPLIDNTLGARITVWYRQDGGWINHMDPYTLTVDDKNANHEESTVFRLAFLWTPSDKWSVTPSFYYQDRKEHNISNYWPLYSNAGNNQFVSADPDLRNSPDTFYLPALKVQGDLGSVTFISNTSFYHRENTTGYEATLYNLGYYQTQNASPIFLLPWYNAAGQQVPFPLLDGGSACSGGMAGTCALHVPGGLQYRASGSSVQNGQENLTQEFRVQSTDPNARLLWTAGIFANENRQTYLEQIRDPMLNDLTMAVLGQPYQSVFGGIGYDPNYPLDSYFLRTSSKDEQLAGFGEATYSFTDQLKLTVGARYSHMKYTFDTLTGGPQLYAMTRPGSGNITENAFTPKVSLQYQHDPNDMYYATYAKGFRPGGANNPIPNAACPTDFQNFGIYEVGTQPGDSLGTFKSDSVKSYEVGAKNNFDNRVRIATSIYYIQWSNIQQLVVPPVCQISFIANTGNATVKGADLQADFSVTSAFTIELALGYTQARYSEEFRFAPPCPGGVAAPNCALDPHPLVADGNAIVSASSETGAGQPTAPFTAALALEYHFPIFARDTFVRLDGQYAAHAKWPTASLDPNTAQFDAANYVTPSTTFVSFRGGMQFEQLSLQAFVDNLTDSHTVTDYNWTIDPTPGANLGYSRLQRSYTFRPRTFGITAIYRR
jgi:outer membrane receptor protein involved in Fe transport